MYAILRDSITVARSSGTLREAGPATRNMNSTLGCATRTDEFTRLSADRDWVMSPFPYLVSYRLRVVLICVMFATLTWCGRHYRLDDALIYARYVLHAY